MKVHRQTVVDTTVVLFWLAVFAATFAAAAWVVVWFWKLFTVTP